MITVLLNSMGTAIYKSTKYPFASYYLFASTSEVFKMNKFETGDLNIILIPYMKNVTTKMHDIQLVFQV